MPIHGSIAEQFANLGLVPKGSCKQATGSTWTAQKEGCLSEAMTAVHRAVTFEQFRSAAYEALIQDPSQVEEIAHFSEQFKSDCLSEEDKEVKRHRNHGKFFNGACWALCNQIFGKCDRELWVFIVKGMCKEEDPKYPNLSKAIAYLEEKRAMTSQEKKQAQKKFSRKH